MAGISVPQYEIFKIGTNKLKYSNWNLQITKKEAFKYQELISLFEAQEFRMMANKILEKPIKSIDFSKIFMQVVVDKKSDFARVTGKKGVKAMVIRLLKSSKMQSVRQKIIYRKLLMPGKKRLMKKKTFVIMNVPFWKKLKMYRLYRNSLWLLVETLLRKEDLEPHS